MDGSTPLCDACSSGSLECVRLLLERGARVNPALTSRTASPLHEACMGGETPRVKPPVRVCDSPDTVFLSCRSEGNTDCVELLVAVGARLEAYDLYHGTPLHVACANGNAGCVKVLLNAGEPHAKQDGKLKR